MRIAFFGGTFDPPHRGHIAIARAAMTRLGLDQVLVAPVGTQPLKGAHSSFEDRLAMVRLAVAAEPGLVASSVDAPLPGGQPNYTFATLQRLQRHLQPSDELFCLLGADSFLTLKRWHQCAELLLVCDFIVAGRPGFSLQQVNDALPEGVENAGEYRENAFTRFVLGGLRAGNQLCSCCRIWTRISPRQRFAPPWPEGRSSKLWLPPRLRSIFAPTRFTGPKRPYDLVTIDKARGDPTQPNGKNGNPPHGIGRRGGLRGQKS